MRVLDVPSLEEQARLPQGKAVSLVDGGGSTGKVILACELAERAFHPSCRVAQVATAVVKIPYAGQGSNILNLKEQSYPRR
jgi:hypothetical protein